MIHVPRDQAAFDRALRRCDLLNEPVSSRILGALPEDACGDDLAEACDRLHAELACPLVICGFTLADVGGVRAIATALRVDPERLRVHQTHPFGYDVYLDGEIALIRGDELFQLTKPAYDRLDTKLDAKLGELCESLATFKQP